MSRVFCFCVHCVDMRRVYWAIICGSTCVLRFDRRSASWLTRDIMTKQVLLFLSTYNEIRQPLTNVLCADISCGEMSQADLLCMDILMKSLRNSGHIVRSSYKANIGTCVTRSLNIGLWLRFTHKVMTNWHNLRSSWKEIIMMTVCLKVYPYCIDDVCLKAFAIVKAGHWCL